MVFLALLGSEIGPVGVLRVGGGFANVDSINGTYVDPINGRSTLD